jgi:DNA polymerase-1
MYRYLTNNEEAESYDIAILVKDINFDAEMLERYYLNNLALVGLGHLNVIFYSLEYKTKKPKAKHMQEYMLGLNSLFIQNKIRYLYVADANYFKHITKEQKPMANLTNFYKVECYEACFGINYSSIKYSEDNRDKLILSLQYIKDKEDNNYIKLGSNIIHNVSYPTGDIEILSALKFLSTKPVLAIDIETYSLDFSKAGLATISFAWSQHDAIAFAIDFSNNHMPNMPIRTYLKAFFDNYQGKSIYHNAGYDVKVLIYNLYMKDLLDTEGMYIGLDTLTRNFDDTYVIAHLALNSCSKPSKSLKDLALSFAGNYAEEVKDIKKLKLDRLLKYNVIDTLSTNYVRDTYYQEVIDSNQEDTYKTLMLDTVKLLLITELSGMPVNMDRVDKVELILSSEEQKALNYLIQQPEIKETLKRIRQDKVDKKNTTLKTIKHNTNMDAYATIEFNANSSDQLQTLLYKVLGLPVVELTKTKQPSVKAKVIEDLKMFAKDDSQIRILDALINYQSVNKILSTFIPALKGAILKPDGNYYLHGSFNIGGTVSFRLSSSNPNLQNLPSGSKYGALIKYCFAPAEGTVMVGADMNSMEDMVNALLTGDTNKLKVYTDGYDSHSLRSYYYFRDKVSKIRQATELDRTYLINGNYLIGTDTITYQNKQYTVEEFYNVHMCSDGK